jgi:hypothetical protein
MNQAAGRPLGSLLEEQPNGRDPLGAGEAIFFPTRRCANAKSATTDRIAQAGLAQVHSERTEINGFAVVEAHQKRKKVVWAGKVRMGAISPFLEAVGNLKSSRLTPDHRTEPENQSTRSFFNAVPSHRDGKQIF